MMVTGGKTSVELVDQCLSRIRALDTGPDGLGAVLALNPDAMNAAAAADEKVRRGGEQLGPLHGIPILVKDVFETAGIATTFGCGAFEGYVPRRDADAVRRLREAGAIVLGKTSTPDLALSWLSDSSTGVNAVNSRSWWHEAGGSSGGSAVAVATRLAPVALGSDTGGSVRVPASFNGVVGMRPTTGLVPTGGMSALVAAQDTPGPLAACVEDVALLLGVLAGECWREQPERPPLAGHRVGLLILPDESAGWHGADEVAACTAEAVGALRAEGARIDAVDVPDLESLLRDGSLYLVSARADIDAFLASRPGLGGRSFLDLYDEDIFPDGLDLATLLATRTQTDPDERARRIANQARLRAAVVHAMSVRRIDALLYPTVQVPAPRRDRDQLRLPSRLLPVNTRVASQAGMPALTLPAGTTEEGLPIGLELLGRPGTDRALLRLAAHVERVLM
jgi:amidase